MAEVLEKASSSLISGLEGFFYRWQSKPAVLYYINNSIATSCRHDYVDMESGWPGILESPFWPGGRRRYKGHRSVWPREAIITTEFDGFK